jgi:hypothetical protein
MGLPIPFVFPSQGQTRLAASGYSGAPCQGANCRFLAPMFFAPDPRLSENQIQRPRKSSSRADICRKTSQSQETSRQFVFEAKADSSNQHQTDSSIDTKPILRIGFGEHVSLATKFSKTILNDITKLRKFQDCSTLTPVEPAAAIFEISKT